MSKNQSELNSLLFAKNAFLEMYVFHDPQIEASSLPNAVEFCDVLVSFHGMIIMIEVKEFNKEKGHAKVEEWMRKRVWRARRQLTVGAKPILSGEKYRIFDKKTKKTILDGGIEHIMLAVVLDRDDIDPYSYVRACPEQGGFVGVNVFSMNDFQMATEAILSPLDFFLYLEKRYFTMIKGEALYPFVMTDKGVVSFKKRMTDEVLMVEQYLASNTKYGNLDNSAARALHRSILSLSKIQGINEWLDELSCITMKIAQEIIDIVNELKNRVQADQLGWNGQFIQSGIDDGKRAIVVAYSAKPKTALRCLKQLEDGVSEMAEPLGIKKAFAMIFHDDGFFQFHDFNFVD